MDKAIKKAFTWRFIASVTTALLAWFFTGKTEAILFIFGADFILKLIFNYGHEKAWDKIN